VTDDDIARRIAERNELTRIAASRILENHEMGRKIADSETLAWARAFVRMHKPLCRPLGTGEPRQDSSASENRIGA
jgi:hypothetical protein